MLGTSDPTSSSTSVGLYVVSPPLKTQGVMSIATGVAAMWALIMAPLARLLSCLPCIRWQSSRVVASPSWSTSHDMFWPPHTSPWGFDTGGLYASPYTPPAYQFPQEALHACPVECCAVCFPPSYQTSICVCHGFNTWANVQNKPLNWCLKNQRTSRIW